MTQGILAKYTVINQNLPLHNGERWPLPWHVSSWNFQPFCQASVKAQYFKTWSRLLRSFIICILVVFHVAKQDTNVILMTWKSTCKKSWMNSSNSEFFLYDVSLMKTTEYIYSTVKKMISKTNKKNYSRLFFLSFSVCGLLCVHAQECS